MRKNEVVEALLYLEPLLRKRMSKTVQKVTKSKQKWRNKDGRFQFTDPLYRKVLT